MANTSMLHIRIDNQLKADAAAKLANIGLTLSDAVRILLTRISQEGGLPVGLTTDAASYDAWFCEKVNQALATSNATVTHQQAMDEAQQLIDRKQRSVLYNVDKNSSN